VGLGELKSDERGGGWGKKGLKKGSERTPRRGVRLSVWNRRLKTKGTREEAKGWQRGKKPGREGTAV